MKNVNYLILNVLLFFCLNVQAQYFNIVPNLPFKSLGTSAKVVVPREHDILVFGDTDTIGGFNQTDEKLFVSKFDYFGNLIDAKYILYNGIPNFSFSIDNMNYQSILLNDSLIVFLCNEGNFDQTSFVALYNVNTNSVTPIGLTGIPFDSNINSYLMDYDNGLIAIAEGLGIYRNFSGTGLTNGLFTIRLIDPIKKSNKLIEVVDTLLGANIKHFKMLPDTSFVLSGIIESMKYPNYIFQTHVDISGKVISHKEFQVKNAALIWKNMTLNAFGELCFLGMNTQGIPDCVQLNHISVNILDRSISNIKSGVCVTHPAVEILEPNVTSLKPSVDLNGLLVCGNASIQSEPFSFLHHSSNEGEIKWFRTYKPINQNNHKITKTNIESITPTPYGYYLLSGNIYDATETRNKFWMMQVDLKGCLNSDCISSIVEKENTLPIRIHPSTTRDMINIEFENKMHGEATISLYHSDGRLLLSDIINISKASYQYNVSQYPSGIYFILLSQGSSKYQQKFVKL